MAIDSSESKLDDFVNLVLSNLEKNGFPNQTVSFPLEKMYESASKRGFSFNKVREILKQRDIATELTEKRVIFSKVAPPEPFFDLSDLAANAQQILQQMSPAERAQIEQMMQNMAPADLENIRQQWETLSPEEKARHQEEIKKMSPSSL